MQKLILGSLFDGIGGFCLAAERVGITSIWSSEIDLFCESRTLKHFPDIEQVGDITKLNGADLEPVDAISGGSPCQDLSIAGKRAGLEGDRSGLFLEMIRVIKEMRNESSNRANEPIRPRFMLWENVPGAFSSNFGEDFWKVLEETAKIADETITIPEPSKQWDKKHQRWRYKWNISGCIMGNGWSIAWRVLDAQYWGVPQRRRRIFLVADFGGSTAPEILFKREGLRRHLTQSRETGEGTTGGAERSVGEASAYSFDSLSSNSMKSKNPHSGCREVNIAKCLDTTDPNPSKNQGGIAIVQNMPVTIDFGRTSDRITINPTVSTTLKGEGGGGGAKTGLYCIQGNCKSDTFAMQAIGEYAQSDISSSLKQRDYKDATNLVVSGCDIRNMKENGDLCGTLQSKEGGGYSLNYIHPVRIGHFVRRLTPLECERLQDYPDNWTEGGSDSARYKSLGNSVAVCCPEYVLEGIVEAVADG